MVQFGTITTIFLTLVGIVILLTASSTFLGELGDAETMIGTDEGTCNLISGCVWNESLSDVNTDTDYLTNMNNVTAKNLQYKASGTTCFMQQVYDVNKTSNLTGISYTATACTIKPKTTAHDGDDWNVTYLYAKSGGDEPCRSSDYQGYACGEQPSVNFIQSIFGNGIVSMMCVAFLFLMVMASLFAIGKR